MRLTDDEINAIVQVIDKHVSDSAQLRLFGSRVDSSKKGGDIDLLLLVDSKQGADHIRSNKSELLADMKERIGDQKIDFLVRTQDEAKTDAFVQVIIADSVCLKRWDS